MPRNFTSKFLSVFFLVSTLFCAHQVKAANSFYSFLIDTAIDTASAVIDSNRNQSSYVPSKANICIADDKTVGDIIESPSGNSAKVVSINGVSPKCKNPLLPIQAELEFTYSFSSKAGMSLSDEYEVKPLTDLQRFQGNLIFASSKTAKNKGLKIFYQAKKPSSDYLGVANSIEKVQSSNLKDSTTSNPQKLKINGTNYVQFEVSGSTKGLFGSQMTYFVTVFEAKDEIVVVNQYCPAEDFSKTKPEFDQMILSIKGIY
jgi:hypothetical protein